MVFEVFLPGGCQPLMWRRLLLFAGGEDKGTDQHGAEWSGMELGRLQPVTAVRDNVVV